MYTCRITTKADLQGLPSSEVVEVVRALDLATVLAQAIATGDRNAVLHLRSKERKVDHVGIDIMLSPDVDEDTFRRAWLEAVSDLNSIVGIRPESAAAIATTDADLPSQARTDRMARRRGRPRKVEGRSTSSRKAVDNG